MVGGRIRWFVITLSSTSWRSLAGEFIARSGLADGVRRRGLGFGCRRGGEASGIKDGLARPEELNSQLPEDRKMIFFQYRSQHLTTPDSSAVFGRVLVVVPGDPERWVQYGVPEAGRPKTQNLSVLAIKKSEDGKNDIYFKDHYRMYEQGEIYLKDRFAVTGQSDNCINCHKSGVLPIFPAPGSFSAEDASKIAAVNARFRTYGPPRFGGYVDPASSGPGLGQRTPEAVAARTSQFMQRCTSGQEFEDPEKSISAIKKSMN